MTNNSEKKEKTLLHLRVFFFKNKIFPRKRDIPNVSVPVCSFSLANPSCISTLYAL